MIQIPKRIHEENGIPEKKYTRERAWVNSKISTFLSSYGDVALFREAGSEDGGGDPCGALRFVAGVI